LEKMGVGKEKEEKGEGRGGGKINRKIGKRRR
jgi:hypothetical protein